MRQRKWWTCVVLAACISAMAHAEQVITADTRLTANIVGTDPSKPCIRIAVSGVTLDLSGFTVVGHGGKGIGIAIDPEVFDVTIRKGTVSGFATGILVNEGATHHLEDVISTRNAEAGIQCMGTAKIRIDGCRSRENDGAGFVLENCSQATLTDNIAQDNADAGFLLTGGTTGSRLERNVSRYNTGPGIQVTGGATANVIRRNTSAQNDTFDLQEDNGNCTGNTWFRNLFLTANVRCID